MQTQEAAISISKNRVKVYPDNQVYLKDKQEFEIELFNPSTLTRLAKITINGKLISQSGLVLKPGQRVYLERFIDTPQKFKFETYVVDSTDKATQIAIASNGDIQVDFYDEYVPPYFTTISVSGISPNSWFGTCTAADGFVGSKTSNSGIGGQSVNSCYSSLASTDSMDLSEKQGLKQHSLLRSIEKETGRVEKGTKSDQQFTNYNGSFNSWTSKIVKIKILPFSEKPLEVQDLINYCTECGAKNKGNKFKFCPSCGNKY